MRKYESQNDSISQSKHREVFVSITIHSSQHAIDENKKQQTRREKAGKDVPHSIALLTVLLYPNERHSLTIH
jgi:hypothetical protein